MLAPGLHASLCITKGALRSACFPGLLLALCIYTALFALQALQKRLGIISSLLGASSITAVCVAGRLEHKAGISPMGNAARSPQAMDWDAGLKLCYFMHSSMIELP